MKGPLKRGLFGALSAWFAWSIAASDARAEAFPVSLAPPPAAGDAAMQRIFAELEQYGYAVAWARHAVSPCTAGARAEATPPGAWISVDLDAGSNQMVATVCAWSAGASPEVASTAAPVSDPRQLALATVEALTMACWLRPLRRRRKSRRRWPRRRCPAWLPSGSGPPRSCQGKVEMSGS